MDGAVKLRVWHGLLIVFAMLGMGLLLVRDMAAQTPSLAGPLLSAEPVPNERLAVAPARIALTAAVPLTPGSARIRLLGRGGLDVPLEPAAVDPDAPARMTAAVAEPLGSGDYTVIWSARAATGGDLLTGAYPFAVGVAGPIGAAGGPNRWPEPWAALLRWTVFLGTAIAGGGFAWSRVIFARPGQRVPGNRLREGVMAGASIVALSSTVAAPVFAWRFAEDGAPFSFEATLLSTPSAWRLQVVALAALALLCFAAVVRGARSSRERAARDWFGAGAGAGALAGIALSSRAAFPVDEPALALELVHLWAAALWFSGGLFFLAGWRGLGTDVARFRTVRWLGGLFLAIAVVTGGARAAPHFAELGDLAASPYGQALVIKTAIVLFVVIRGGVAMLGTEGAHAVQASRFLGVQALCGGVAALLSAPLALLAPPGIAAPATLAGIALGEVVVLDRDAFGAERGVLHLLTQPGTPGAQTLAVRLTDADGAPLAAAEAPEVEVVWMPLDGMAPPADAVTLAADPAGAVFTGAANFVAGWQQADVVLTPRGGIASRARFWLVAPDPNVTGEGPTAVDNAEAEALYDRGLASLTALRSVRYSQRVGDGSGTVARTEVSVSAAEGERPAAFAETVLDANGEAASRQTMVGARRWTEEDGAWAAAEPVPFLVPAAWGAGYAGAAGFGLGPREAVDGELSQVVTFRTPASGDSGREPAWYAWWVGLASGQVRREVMVSTREYVATEFRDFNVDFDIQPPAADANTPDGPTPAATPIPADSP